MKRLKIITTTVIMLIVHVASAQDFPYHFFAHSVSLAMNPSLAAINHNLTVDVASYNLWAAGFKPLNDNLISFSINPTKTYNIKEQYSPKIGVAINFLNENNGPFTQNILQLIYAYHIPLNRDLQLSLGVCGIVENIEIKVNSLSAENIDDPRLLTGNNHTFAFDGGFGATLKNESFLLSFSALNLAPADFSFDDASVMNVENFRKFYLSGQYKAELSRKINLEPTITLRNTRYEDFSFDTSCSINFDAFLVGAGYRNEKTIFAFAKISFKNFVFTYTSENPLEANHMAGQGHTFSLGWYMNSIRSY